MTVAKIQTAVLLTAALSCSVVFAQGNIRVTKANDQHRVQFALHGNTSCVMVDDKIFCAPGFTRAPIKLASTAPN